MKTIKCNDNWGREVELPAERFKMRPSVYAVLRRDGCFLVCRTKSTGKLWLPGGGVDENETHLEALGRELIEEAGIYNIKIGRLLKSFQHYCYYAPFDEACDAHLYFYECWTDCEKLKSNEEIEDGEAMDFEWMDRNQILKEGFCDVNEEIQDILASLS